MHEESVLPIFISITLCRVCLFPIWKSWQKKKNEEKGKGFRFRKRNNKESFWKRGFSVPKMKTTKGGKVMNPTDAYRKELRKKELKRVLFKGMSLKNKGWWVWIHSVKLGSQTTKKTLFWTIRKSLRKRGINLTHVTLSFVNNIE